MRDNQLYGHTHHININTVYILHYLFPFVSFPFLLLCNSYNLYNYRCFLKKFQT